MKGLWWEVWVWEGSKQKHPEISRSKKPLAPPGLEGQGQGICLQSPLRVGALLAGTCQNSAACQRWGELEGPAEESPGSNLSSHSPGSPSHPRAWTVGPPHTEQDRERYRKESEDGKCRTQGTGTIPYTHLLLRGFVHRPVHSGYYNNFFLFPPFSCNSWILSQVTLGSWSPRSKCQSDLIQSLLLIEPIFSNWPVAMRSDPVCSGSTSSLPTSFSFSFGTFR